METGRVVAMVGEGVNDAAMAFSSVFVVTSSLRLRRFHSVSTTVVREVETPAMPLEPWARPHRELPDEFTAHPIERITS